MTNYRSARAGAVKPLRLVAQPLRALGLDRSARPSKEACRDMNAGNSLEGTAFGKKVRKKRSRQPQKLLFGRRPPDAESLPQAQPAGVRKPAREDTMGPATRVWHHRCCRQSDGAPHE